MSVICSALAKGLFSIVCIIDAGSTKALSPENPSLRLIIAVEVIVNSNKDSDFYTGSKVIIIRLSIQFNNLSIPYSRKIQFLCSMIYIIIHNEKH
ncbi:hypothetical protein I090019C5_15910 [Phocaeicola massiliensis]